MLDRIHRLESLARQIEPSTSERQQLNSSVIHYADNFLENIYRLPAYVVTEDKGIGLYDSPISENPSDIQTLLGLLKHNVDRPGLNPASGGHLGYIPGGGIYTSALGDYLADVTNRYAGVFFGSPGAVRMENMLIDWMASVVGYPATTAGNLTSGGSIANLIGIVTAREARGVKSKDIERSAIYLTEHVHHSVDKAIRIAGLQESVLRHVPMDSLFRMDADALERLIVADKKAGVRPWLVIASAGTTDVGAVDPMDTIAAIARNHGMWFHVDGAYGGFFILCEEGKKILKGMEASDSLVVDPHKGLFLPYGSGAVLVKDKAPLAQAHHYTANYMQDAQSSREELSPADLSPELTKHFRGLRLWLPLKLHGVAPFRAGVEEKLMLARYFHEQIQKIEGFEAGPAPALSIVTYRYIPKRGGANEFNKRLVDEVHRDGRVFISSTMIGGNFTLRLAVLAFRTHLETIDLTLKILREKAQYLAETM
ncbi:MAG TPA: aminotransferase class V-fold PLP-dependent enzyme [Bacteroidota bacterium]|jgi:glutamate/tyrosine decarboxylase-like PLP-dependent enzyme|nr:aminotransferase class V-fold PLP-dependent enzyme [Bacteroidota bacterium]